MNEQDKSQTEKPKPPALTIGPVVQRNVRHNFTPEELAKISSTIVTALASKSNLETEFDSIKASYKARISEQDSLIATCATAHRAGFEMRVQDCQVLYDAPNRRKFFILIETQETVGMEPMTDDDLQMDLIAAEKDFERREEIPLFDAGADKGLLVVGRMKDKWYSALRLKIKQHALSERLDSEQKNYLQRWDAIGQASNRAMDWIVANFGKDVAKGFAEPFDKAIEPHKERAE